MCALPWSRLGVAALGAVTVGCHGERESVPSATDPPELAELVEAPAPFGARAERALEPASLGEAIRALRPYAPRGHSVLEVRADGTRVVLQARVGESATVAEYSYDGRVLGPAPIHLDGDGELGANLFDLDAVDWDALGKLFPKARAAVDPLDGRVTGLVVRRHLPFDADVRARLYVASPRMSGHLDADARGAELSAPPAP